MNGKKFGLLTVRAIFSLTFYLNGRMENGLTSVPGSFDSTYLNFYIPLQLSLYALCMHEHSTNLAG